MKKNKTIDKILTKNVNVRFYRSRLSSDEPRLRERTKLIDVHYEKKDTALVEKCHDNKDSNDHNDSHDNIKHDNNNNDNNDKEDTFNNEWSKESKENNINKGSGNMINIIYDYEKMKKSVIQRAELETSHRLEIVQTTHENVLNNLSDLCADLSRSRERLAQRAEARERLVTQSIKEDMLQIEIDSKKTASNYHIKNILYTVCRRNMTCFFKRK